VSKKMKRTIPYLAVALIAVAVTVYAESWDFDSHVHLNQTNMVKHGVSLQYLPPPPGLLTVKLPPKVDGGECVEALWQFSTTNQYIQIPVHREIRDGKLVICLWADSATLTASRLEVRFEPTNSIHGTKFHFDFSELLKTDTESSQQSPAR
jgi:hypothetical protein